MSSTNKEMDRLLKLWKQIQRRLREQAISWGLNTYLTGQVMRESDGNGERVAFKVKKYDVGLDLQDFKNCTCSCISDKRCRHMVAAFFLAYSYHGRPELLIQQYYKKQEKKDQKKRLKEITSKHVKRKGKSPAIVNDIQKKLVAEWDQFMEASVREARILNQTDPHLLINKIDEAINLHETVQLKPELKPYFTFYRQWFILYKVMQLYEHLDQTIVSPLQESLFQEAVEACLNDCEENTMVSTLEDKEMNAAMLDILTKWAVFSSSNVIDWARAFRLFVQAISMEPKDLEKEKRKLLTEWEKRVEERSVIRNNCLNLLAQIEFILGNDYDAIDWYKKKNTIFMNEVMELLNLLHKVSEWDRLYIWVRFLMSNLSELTEKQMHRLFSFLETLEEKIPSFKSTEYEELLSTNLPQTKPIYDRYLMQAERWKDFLELQILFATEPEQFYEAFHNMEQAHSELLLPIIHHAVERSVLEKNREGYRKAVEYLHVLKEQYVRSGQNERFNTYVGFLRKRFKSYRALLEEIEKGSVWI